MLALGVAIGLLCVAVTADIALENAGHLVDKNDLMKQVWPDAFVEEGSLNKNIFVLRKTLGQWDGGRGDNLNPSAAPAGACICREFAGRRASRPGRL